MGIRCVLPRQIRPPSGIACIDTHVNQHLSWETSPTTTRFGSTSTWMSIVSGIVRLSAEPTAKELEELYAEMSGPPAGVRSSPDYYNS